MEGIRRTDSFMVFTKGHLSVADFQVLTLLYQPIIGSDSYSLYMVLYGLLNRQTLISDTYHHGFLESLLNLRLEVIEKNRSRLEAIGLLSSYYLNDHFVYEIKCPLSAESFVNDGILGQYLIQSITKDKFKKVLNLFKVKTPNIKQYFKISKSFEEVYESIQTDEMVMENELMSSKKSESVKVNHTNFEWRLFIESIPESVYDTKNFSERMKEKILNLAYVYGLDEIDMREVFIKSIGNNQEVEINRLAIVAREHFQMITTYSSDKLLPKEPEIRNLPTDPKEYFRVISPRALLKEMGGGMVSSADLRIVERLIEEVGLEKEVVNVLIAYIAKIKNGVLPTYEYFEKVAQSWKRNKITNVDLAMDYVIHLNSQAKSTQDKTSTKGKKSTKPDIQVDWLQDYLDSI